MQLTIYPNGEIRARVSASPLADFFAPRGKRNFPSEEPGVLSCLSFKSCDKGESIDQRLSVGSPSFDSEPSVSRPGWGSPPRPTNFSLYARRKIVRCGALLCSDEEREQTLFLTGTLPGGTEDALRSMADYSGWIVHEILTSIPRWWHGTASDARFIWVWEWQKRGALHWHCVICCPSVSAASAVREKFGDLWVRIIRSVSEKSGVDLAERAEGGSWADCPEVWRIEAEPARKNPCRYLAKYCSKAKTPSSPDCPFPSRWYGISRSLHVLLNQNTEVYFHPDRLENRPSFLGEKSSEVVEVLGRLCYKTVSFVDKVRDGFTSVFYFAEGVKDSIVEALSVLGFERGIYCNGVVRGSKMEFFYLNLIREYPRARERFLSDIGEVSRGEVESYYQGYLVPVGVLRTLNLYAQKVLVFEGVLSQRNPPLGSVARVDVPESNKIESSPPPDDWYDQPSLFP